MKNKTFSPISLLRWIVFLPGALGAAWLAWILINFLGRFSLGYVGIQSDSFLGQFYFNTAGHAAMGAAFVFVGAYITPSHRKVVAYCFAGIGLVISGFMLFPSIAVKNYWAIWGSLCVVLGIGAVTYSIYQGEIKTD
ncbi:MAG: hypothetical protein SCARUB_02584 [Candidatus Scalindua rubra]|uniref:Uncharacterized protein n=1 Tax=Candidatus Scalindua rubra TaxID=1872076 RepID=A0A1E3X9J5_9BACT|nr:MAG: hypothetical protein SCARUB_02584 [Candidatus Scalindua rubra]